MDRYLTKMAKSCTVEKIVIVYHAHQMNLLLLLLYNQHNSFDGSVVIHLYSSVWHATLSVPKISLSILFKSGEDEVGVVGLDKGGLGWGEGVEVGGRVGGVRWVGRAWTVRLGSCGRKENSVFNSVSCNPLICHFHVSFSSMTCGGHNHRHFRVKGLQTGYISCFFFMQCRPPKSDRIINVLIEVALTEEDHGHVAIAR